MIEDDPSFPLTTPSAAPGETGTVDAALAAANEALRREVAERRRAEAQLTESRGRYEQLFATVSDALMIFDAETRRFAAVNDRACALYGYSRDEFLHLRYADITAEPAASDRAIREMLEGRRLLYVTSDTCHPNRLGHQILAEALFERIFMSRLGK